MTSVERKPTEETKPRRFIQAYHFNPDRDIDTVRAESESGGPFGWELGRYLRKGLWFSRENRGTGQPELGHPIRRLKKMLL